MLLKKDYDFATLNNEVWGPAKLNFEKVSDYKLEDEFMEYLENYFNDIPTISEVNDFVGYTMDLKKWIAQSIDIDKNMSIHNIRKILLDLSDSIEIDRKIKDIYYLKKENLFEKYIKSNFRTIDDILCFLDINFIDSIFQELDKFAK